MVVLGIQLVLLDLGEAQLVYSSELGVVGIEELVMDLLLEVRIGVVLINVLILQVVDVLGGKGGHELLNVR